jgi:tRNA (guanine-N7-)-methyltransferase
MPGHRSPDRIPLDHPDYRYPPSRNPYWSKIKDQVEGLHAPVRLDNATEEFCGRWQTQFPPAPSPARSERRPLHVEVGCSTGHVILEWAARDPKGLYIGVDWKYKIISRAAEKAQKRGLKNLLFFRAHAERLHYMFAPGEIDFLYLFFPDPWSKKSQLKNRFINAERLRKTAKLMAPGGVFHIKTDHAGYFDWMCEAIEQVQDIWEIVDLTRDLHAGHPAPETLKVPEVTLFEGLFIKDQIPIKSVKLRRRSSV